MLRRRCGVFMFYSWNLRFVARPAVVGGGARRGYGWPSPGPPAPGLAFSPPEQERSPRPGGSNRGDLFRTTSLLSNVRNGSKLAQVVKMLWQDQVGRLITPVFSAY